MTKVLIITGPAGDAQGWGDFSVTEAVGNALNSGFAAFFRCSADRTVDVFSPVLNHQCELKAEMRTPGVNASTHRVCVGGADGVSRYAADACWTIQREMQGVPAARCY